MVIVIIVEKKKNNKDLNPKNLKKIIRDKMKQENWSLEQLVSQFDLLNEEAFVLQIRAMIKEGEVIMENTENICLVPKK